MVGPMAIVNFNRQQNREQHELYDAAKVIQNAFRQYQQRILSQRQTESETNAAITIQSYYRRYKQYIYFKKLHSAAVLIQKHYRIYRARATKVHPTHRSDIIQMKTVAFGDLEEEEEICCSAQYDGVQCEEAAICIQTAYRGHYMRKRHAAATKIQNFLRHSHKKRRIHSNGNAGKPSNRSAREFGDDAVPSM